MSTDSLAAFRRSVGPELAGLAEEHLKHDLRQSDRDALQSAAKTVSLHTGIGSALGIGLGLLLAFRLRRSRARVFEVVKARERPTAVRFSDGREEPLPDFTPMLRPSVIGDIATYTLLGAGGLFIGGETGLLTGSISAGLQINADRESRERIEVAFRRFRADALRREADALEQEREGLYGL